MKRCLQRWWDGVFTGLGIDLARIGTITEADAENLRDQCNRFTIAGLYVAGITTSLGAVLPWFTDFLLFSTGSAEFEVMLIVRSLIVALTLIIVIGFRFVSWTGRHPYGFGLMIFATMMSVAGWSVTKVNGFDSPLTYAVYTTPLLSLVLFVELKRRVLATAGILVPFFGALFLTEPRQLQHPFAGTAMVWSVASAFAAVAAGHLVYVVIRANLIQKRKLDDLTGHLQERIAEQTREIRQLTGSMFTVQEEERTRISHDLHDELGQMLFRLNMEVEMMQHQSAEPAAQAESFGDSLNVLKKLVGQVHDALDRILGALRPIMLENQGFDVAITRMAHNVASRNNLAAEVLFNAETDDFTDTAKTALYRIVQEGLTNIAKHAGASRAGIEFRMEAGELLLLVYDDGKGFNPDEAGGKNRLGLRGMRERVKLLDGHIHIHTRAGGGTEIAIRFPMKPILKGDET